MRGNAISLASASLRTRDGPGKPGRGAWLVEGAHPSAGSRCLCQDAAQPGSPVPRSASVSGVRAGSGRPVNRVLARKFVACAPSRWVRHRRGYLAKGKPGTGVEFARLGLLHLEAGLQGGPVDAGGQAHTSDTSRRDRSLQGVGADPAGAEGGWVDAGAEPARGRSS